MDAAAWALGRERVAGFAPSDGREKATLLAALYLAVMTGYYAVGLTLDPARAASLHTPLDDLFPFSPVWMYAYEGVYTSCMLPLFVIRCRHLFRRAIAAYAIAAAVCTVVWVIYPVSALELRGDVSGLDLSRFHNWGLRVNYALDTPINLFPSLHMASTALAALCVWKARRLYGLVGFVVVALVFVAIACVKQHFVVDGLAGLALAGVVYWFVVRPYEPADEDRDRVAYSWRGLVGYLVVHAALVAGFYAAFLLDWRPWEQ